MHFAGFVQAHTQLALEVDCRLLCQHLQQSFCPDTTTVEALAVQCSIWLHFFPMPSKLHTACLLSTQRALRKSHVWEDTLCV